MVKGYNASVLLPMPRFMVPCLRSEVSIREQVKPLHGVSGTDQHGTSVWSSFRPFRRIGPLRGQCHLIGIGSEATAGGGMRSHASLDCPTLIVEVERYDWRPRHASVQSNVGKTRASLARPWLGYIKIHVTPHLQKWPCAATFSLCQ